MDTYHVVIDDSMIRNSLQTNLNESSDLFSFKIFIYLFLLGILPSYFIYKANVHYKPLKQEIFSKFKTLFITLVIIVLIIVSFSKFYTSFFREHKSLRYHTNPTYWIYSIGKYISNSIDSADIVIRPIGEDAKIEDKQLKLMIVVVGEAARADRFSLNGYEKDTNPLLKQENLVSFSNFYSCATSTAESVPCMFSIYNRDDYSYKKAMSSENVIDVLAHTNKVSILWRDNNSDSKGVALRTNYEDYKTSELNTVCNEEECRDEGMLVGLTEFIEQNRDKNILIILHQMGNHGPAYYKRYPKEFEKFIPVCRTNQFEKCTKEEIDNGYDNAILYTDYFLSKVINFLKKYQNSYKTGMIYMSDHGESLGENGVYLHGLPYFMAPKEQKHIGSIIWLGENESDIMEKIYAKKDEELSHDNLFSTILGFFNVKTQVYDPKMDILN